MGRRHSLMFIWPGNGEEAKAVSRAEPRCNPSLGVKWGVEGPGLIPASPSGRKVRFTTGQRPLLISQ